MTEDPPDRGVPGRRWFRLAVLVALSLLVLLALVVVFNLGRGKTPLGAEPGQESPTASQSPEQRAPTELRVVSARDLDPQGVPPEENGELAPLVIDGDPTTSWRTSTYAQQLGPGGLKTGVGLVLDLGESREVAEIELSVVGVPTGVSYYLSEDDPSAVAGLDEVARLRADQQRLRTRLDQPATGRYLVVWLTELPVAEGGFRGTVAEVVVRG